MSAPIFIDNPGILVNKDYIFDFIPDLKASTEERINAIVRFSLYFSLVLMVVKNNYRYFYIFLATLIITYLFYTNNRENFTGNIEKNEDSNNNADSENENENGNGNENETKNESVNCDEPKCENLFMNVLPTDDFTKKKPACSYTKEISQKVNKGFYSKFKKDVNTFYNQDFGMRQFYSMPNTQVPNDQGTFAKWLYNTPVSCSTGDNNILKQYRSCNMNHATLEDLENGEKDNFLCLSKNYTEV